MNPQNYQTLRYGAHKQNRSRKFVSKDIQNPAQSLQTENGQWKRSERATRAKSVMDGGDLQEADHSTVSCVGLFGARGGKLCYLA